MESASNDAMLGTASVDPTPLFELYRGRHATELLTAAVAHFDLFGRLARGPMSVGELGKELGLEARPMTVLVVALRAMKLLQMDAGDCLDLTLMAREHLVPGGAFYVGDYIALSADTAGVVEMVQRLRTNRPAGAKPTNPAEGAAESGDEGVAYIYRGGTESAMEKEASARRFTLALAGRAKNVAPVLAKNFPLPRSRRLLDVGGGTGIYSLALLRRNPGLRAVVWDRPEVLKVAREMAEQQGLTDRVDLVPGDMFTDAVPSGCDVVLLSNILHDWDIPECRALVTRCAEALPQGGQLLIHDVFLNDAMDGPLPIALYSSNLFAVTEGRAYSAGEYREFLRSAGLEPGDIIPTLIHCGVLPGVKR